MSWQKIGPKEKRLIIKDWAADFPEFTQVGTMRLMRRWGPVICGVCLQTHLTDYTAGFHVHCLLRPFPCVSLSCHTKLEHRYLHFEWHERGYREWTQQLRARMAPFLGGTLSFDSLREFCRSKLREALYQFQADVPDDLARVSRWLGRDDWLEDYRFACDFFQQLPDHVQCQLGGYESWKTDLDHATADRSILDQVLLPELKRHKLEAIAVDCLV
jgi:hypothetical protein